MFIAWPPIDFDYREDPVVISGKLITRYLAPHPLTASPCTDKHLLPAVDQAGLLIIIKVFQTEPF